jgi:uncharacterized alkaline shock family protein YloU
MIIRFLHLVSGAVIQLLFLATGFALFVANLAAVEVGLLGRFCLPEARWMGGATGVGVVALGVLYVATRPQNRRTRFITFKSGNGSVSVSVNAVRDYIRKISGEFGSVVSLTPTIRMEKDRMEIDLAVNLVAGAKVPELMQRLPDRIREVLHDGLGVANVGNIGVTISEITGDPMPERRGGWTS